MWRWCEVNHSLLLLPLHVQCSNNNDNTLLSDRFNIIQYIKNKTAWFLLFFSYSLHFESWITFIFIAGHVELNPLKFWFLNCLYIKWRDFFFCSAKQLLLIQTITMKSEQRNSSHFRLHSLVSSKTPRTNEFNCFVYVS